MRTVETPELRRQEPSDALLGVLKDLNVELTMARENLFASSGSCCVSSVCEFGRNCYSKAGNDQ